MKKVSLKDIAARVGVSAALVSYVLNNKKEDRIGREVAQRIRDVAKQMNYRVNLAAKSLKTNKTFTIGLIVADISNPFFSSLARIIEDEAHNRNYTVIFGSSDEQAEKSDKLVETLLNRQVDGLIIAPPEHAEEQILQLERQEIPFVLIDRYFPSIPANFVTLDNYDAAYRAVQHLIDAGYNRIGMVAFKSGIYNLAERTRGYREALEANHIGFRKDWLKEVTPIHEARSVEIAIDELLKGKHPVQAILFGSNLVALRGLKYINSLNIRIPADLAVVSFDESEALELFYTPITHLKQPMQEMGKLAMQLLLQNIDGEKKRSGTEMKATLVVRESTKRKPGNKKSRR